MDYSQKLQYHYRPKKGWINDPNGLVYFNGYYHVFYQHSPDFETPWKQPMHWGHARTKDFLSWEELPIALTPNTSYDKDGCWSGTAIVKDGILYLIYASIKGYNKEQKLNSPPTDYDGEQMQTVSVAFSRDGIHFEKYKKNPVIDRFPPEGSLDFRDPAVCLVDGTYYCVMASGNPEDRAARLLLYKSDNLFDWEYLGVMREWSEGRWTECPSLVPSGDKYLLTVSVQPLGKPHYFQAIYGNFKDGKFIPEISAELDKGPDQYAGQVFRDHLERNLLMSWIPGWRYKGYAEKDVGHMSVPRELKLEDGRITAYPIEELRHLLKDEDEAVKRTANGFIIERAGRSPVVYEGEINDLKILRDGFIVEVFVNGGEEIYTALL